jgi:hypothetical protein
MPARLIDATPGFRRLALSKIAPRFEEKVGKRARGRTS